MNGCRSEVSVALHVSDHDLCICIMLCYIFVFA